MSRTAAIAALTAAFDSFSLMVKNRLSAMLPKAGGTLTGRISLAGDNMVLGEYYTSPKSLVAGNWYRIFGSGPIVGGHSFRLVIVCGISGQRLILNIHRNDTIHWVDVERQLQGFSAPAATAPYVTEVRLINPGNSGNFFIDVKIAGNTVSQTYKLYIESNTYNSSFLNGFGDQGTGVDGIAYTVGDLLNGRFSSVSTTPYYAQYLDGRLIGNFRTKERIQIVGAATGAQTLSIRDYDVFDFTLTGNATSAISNLSAAANEEITIVVRLRQGGTAYTWAWWSGITWLNSSGTSTTPEALKAKEYLLTYNTTHGWIGREGQGN